MSLDLQESDWQRITHTETRPPHRFSKTRHLRTLQVILAPLLIEVSPNPERGENVGLAIRLETLENPAQDLDQIHEDCAENLVYVVTSTTIHQDRWEAREVMEEVWKTPLISLVAPG